MASRKSQSEFRTPGGDDAAPPPTQSERPEFESPRSDKATFAAADVEVDAFIANVDSGILAAKAELEKLLASTCGDSEGPQSQAAMDANIVGVGIGLGDGTLAAAAPGDAVLEVYTLEPESTSELRARLASVTGASAFADSSVPIHAVHTGVVDAQPHRMRLRPAPGGISCGQVAITAGTLGCLVRGNSAPRNAAS